MFIITHLLFLIALLVSSSSAQVTKGTITAPAPNTTVAPGQSFNFTYEPHADYGISSYNITVCLFTSPLSDLSSNNGTGHCYGRYQVANYPAVEYANPALPSILTVPDFSKSVPGFGAPATASDLPIYLWLMEEWGNGDPSVGYRIYFTDVELMYNVSSGST